MRTFKEIKESVEKVQEEKQIEYETQLEIFKRVMSEELDKCFAKIDTTTRVLNDLERAMIRNDVQTHIMLDKNHFRYQVAMPVTADFECMLDRAADKALNQSRITIDSEEYSRLRMKFLTETIQKHFEKPEDMVRVKFFLPSLLSAYYLMQFDVVE